MFQKILNVLDFAKGKKTMIASIALLISAVLAANGVPVTNIEIVTLFNAIISNAAVIVSAVGVVYGLIMKVVRKFRK